MCTHDVFRSIRMIPSSTNRCVKMMTFHPKDEILDALNELTNGSMRRGSNKFLKESIPNELPYPLTVIV